MNLSDSYQDKCALATQQLRRTWLAWGIAPLTTAALLVFTVGTVWAKPIEADPHNIERGFQAVLAVCAALFLVAFWLDGRWTAKETVGRRLRRAVGGDAVPLSRDQLAAHCDVVFKSIQSSHMALTAIGSAIAVAAVMSVWAGLSVAQGAQIIVLGLGYQLFVVSRHPDYDETLTAAARGLLEAAPDDANDHNAR